MNRHLTPEIGLAYLENRLDAAQTVKLERHLANCDACRAELDGQRAVQDLLNSAGQANIRPSKRPSWYAVQAERETSPWAKQFAPIWRAAAVGMIALMSLIWWSSDSLLSSVDPEPLVSVTLTPQSFPTKERPTQTEETNSSHPIEQAITVPHTTITSTTTGNAAEASPQITQKQTISRPFISPAGRLAFTQNGRVYVESEPMNGDYQLVGENLILFHWAEESEILLLAHATGNENLNASDLVTFDAISKKSTAVSDLLDIERTRPSSAFPRLSPDGKTLWFSLLLSSYLDGQVWSFNLETGLWTGYGNLGPIIDSQFVINSNIALTTVDCGSVCYDLTAISPGSSPESHATHNFRGYYGVAENGRFAYGGILDDVTGTFAVEKLDLITFESSLIAPLPENYDEYLHDYSLGTYRMHPVSPDGSHVAIPLGKGAWEMFDVEGRSYGRQENASVLDWRPNGGPVLAQKTADGLNQLVYWEPDYQKFPRIFVRPSMFEFVDGAWANNGQYFAYIAYSEKDKARYLYLWDPADGLSHFIIGLPTSQALSGINWLPNGNGLYFKTADSIYLYDISSQQTRAVMPE